MTSTINVTVRGVPAPQGSKTGVVRGGRAVLIEGGSATGRRKHKAWRAAVTAEAMLHRREVAWDPDLPVGVAATFVMPPPQRLPKRLVGAPQAKKPDLDKLVRSTLDGLEDGGLLPGGDSRVCTLNVHKRYPDAGESTGAYLLVWPIFDGREAT